jgi:hypothetical protein
VLVLSGTPVVASHCGAFTSIICAATRNTDAERSNGSLWAQWNIDNQLQGMGGELVRRSAGIFIRRRDSTTPNPQPADLDGLHRYRPTGGAARTGPSRTRPRRTGARRSPPRSHHHYRRVAPWFASTYFDRLIRWRQPEASGFLFDGFTDMLLWPGDKLRCGIDYIALERSDRTGSSPATVDASPK